jgi:hypothetical protein
LSREAGAPPAARRVASALAGALLVVAFATTPAAQASVFCEHTDTPVAQLRVTPFEGAKIDLDFAAAVVRREGNHIAVIDPLQLGGQGKRVRVDCEGTRATVFNTDVVVFRQSGISLSTLDLAGGPLGPGLTAETDGSSEIEAVFRAKRGSLGLGLIAGTPSPDDWVFGGTSHVVSAFLDRSRPDEADVIYSGPGISVAGVESRDGSDRVDARPARARGAFFLFKGGGGDDVLLGSRLRDSLDGGSGRDLLRAGAGTDEILSRDRFPDRVQCGPGNDRAAPGKGDRLSECERVRAPFGRPAAAR